MIHHPPIAEWIGFGLRRILGIVSATAISLAMAGTAHADEPPTFFRGLNLNGPPVVIDGQAWEGGDSKLYRCADKAFENDLVALVPKTDAQRSKMIRSSRWDGNEVVLTEVPDGLYSVFLYVWEDNDSETFSISVNGKEVLPNYKSGAAGHWEKLGPWLTKSQDGTIAITSRGGAANFSGIEIWRGKHSGASIVKPSAEALAHFEKRIRPVLVEHCYQCHSAAAKKLEGELRLDSRAGWQTGGQSGPAIVTGDPDNSLLMQALRHQDEGLQMPPDKKLPDEVLADFALWIKQGAADPREEDVLTAGKRERLLAESRQRWSFTSPIDPPLPAVQKNEWPKNGVDHFILQRLEATQLSPAADADKRTLIRRATYDLTGLPPTPEEVEAFLANKSSNALTKVVDRLLDSPRYGERWGRHWLDVVRYADTAGDNSDFPIPQMYLYRNWVIEAFQQDLPYDQFVREQLAGDLLPCASEAERHRRIIATGYIANARRFGSRVDDYPQHLTIEDTIDNVGRAFLGLTINCARCHDHKFDPISTEDYYGVYGVFHSTRYPWPGIELEQQQRDLIPLVSDQEAAAALETHRQRQTELDAEATRLEQQRDGATGEEQERLKKEAAAARTAAQEHSKSPLAIAQAYAVTEAGRIEDVRVQYKGDPAKTGPLVARRFPLALGGQTLSSEDSTSGRLSLANWIADRQNPLTARVMVNRIWLHHFGQGLVPTPNDFGKQGKPATHPELLDWLAQRFVESGWSVKGMHRLMMLSHTYQLAAIHDPATIPGDPANDLLSGFRRQRLDAESLRDALLMLGGNLDETMGGPHPFPPMTQWKFTQHNPFKAVYDSRHRSVYLMTQRIQRHPYLAIFDGPDTSASTAFRQTSTTPLQALFLMNNPLVHEQAERIAQRVQKEGATQEERIDRAYQLLLSRPPDAEESAAAQEYFERAIVALEKLGVPSQERDDLAWRSYIRSLLMLNEFVYLD